MKTRLQYAIAVLCLLVSIMDAQVPTSGLVAYYPLNGSAVDMSGNGYSGAIIGTPVSTTDRFGNSGCALDFAGAQAEILLPHISALDNALTVSVSAWLKVYGGVSDVQTLVGKWGDDPSTQSWTVDLYNGTVIPDFVVATSEQDFHCDPSSPLSTDTWAHIVSVYDGSTCKVYVNGELSKTLDVAGDLITDTTALLIAGHNIDSDRNYVNGALDDIRIYDRALSSSEVQALYAENSYVSTGSLSFYHTISSVPAFKKPAQIASGGSAPKVCADGSDATLVVYRESSDITGTRTIAIAEDPDGGSADIYGSFTVSSDSTTARTLAFTYHHPTNPPATSDLKRTITVQVTNASTGQIVASNEMYIYRAPVLLVHGLKGKASDFDAMRKSLNKSSWPASITYAVDYSATNTYSFASNTVVVPHAIYSLIQQARNGGYSSGKVDILGYSMGGILARLYLQGNLFQNNVNRLITLNTPHSGSPWGNVEQAISNAIFEFFPTSLVDVRCGALKDLALGSSAIVSDLNGSTLNAHVIPSHAIVTSTKLMQLEGWWSLLMLADPQFIVQNLAAEGFLAWMFNSTDNDLVVSTTSQTGGLSATSTASTSVWHCQSPSDASVIEEVERVLNASPTDGSTYSTDGFSPSTDFTPFSKQSKLVERSQVQSRKRTISGTMQIVSPASGSEVLGGQSVSVSANGSTGINRLLFAAGNSALTLAIDTANSSSHNFQYTIPTSALGRISIMVAGFTDSVFVAIDTIYLNVSANSDLDSIQVCPDHIYIRVGDTSSVSLTGYYSDGVNRDLGNQVLDSVWSSDRSVSMIVGRDFIKGVAVGEATLNVSYQSSTVSVPVTVVASDAWTTVSVNNSDNSSRLETIPTGTSLCQNYPNPFNPTTTIRYGLPKRSEVRLVVYDLLGREVARLINGEQEAGYHDVQFNASHLASGVYFYQLTAGTFMQTRKLLLLK